jgi:hypothetical protein
MLSVWFKSQVQEGFTTETRRYTEKKGSGFSGWKDFQDKRN